MCVPVPGSGGRSNGGDTGDAAARMWTAGRHVLRHAGTCFLNFQILLNANVYY